MLRRGMLDGATDARRQMAGRPSLGGERIDVGAQFVARNAGRALDIKDALSGNALLRPSRDRRLVQTEVSRQSGKSLAAPAQENGQIVAHASNSCATCISRQVALLTVELTTRRTNGNIFPIMNVERIHKTKHGRECRYRTSESKAFIPLSPATTKPAFTATIAACHARGWPETK